MGGKEREEEGGIQRIGSEREVKKGKGGERLEKA